MIQDHLLWQNELELYKHEDFSPSKGHLLPWINFSDPTSSGNLHRQTMEKTSQFPDSPGDDRWYITVLLELRHSRILCDLGPRREEEGGGLKVDVQKAVKLI